jgi:5-methylcytosine-specific restriction protein B
MSQTVLISPFTTADGTLTYDMVHGRFYAFCQQARQRRGTCVLIIDEINRANVAGVFGELMYLLEYRDQEIALSGGGRFSIPGNVRILATMNTADRSIALVDHALRRRFAFIHLPPNYDLLRHYHQTTDYDPSALIHVLEHLNQQLDDPHYQLGTSFFMRPDLADQLEDIWRMEIEPYLEEYFFDQTNQIEAFRWQKIAKEIEG